DDVTRLMQRAGRGLADFILDEYDDAKAITVVCGPGNNGGDGKVAARLLRRAERSVRIVESKPEGGEKDLGNPDLIVHALFGTGFSGEPRRGAAGLIEQMSRMDVDVVSVDVPSGVDASTGEIAGAVVDAEWTVTFHREKVGLYVAPGALHRGEIEVVDIGLDDHETT